MLVHRSAPTSSVWASRRLAIGRQFCASPQVQASKGNYSLVTTVANNSARSILKQPGSLSVALRRSETSAYLPNQSIRRFSATEAAQPIQVQLYQYAICPFCNRVKALLDYAGVKYGSTEVNPLTKAEIKPWKEQHTKVPIATLTSKNGELTPIFGSDVIVNGLLKDPSVQSKLTERWKGSQMTLETFQNGTGVEQWTDFAVNDLASLLYPNMCRTWSDSYRAFDYVHRTDSFGPLQRIMIQSLGSLAMYFAASKVKKKRNITDERQDLEDVLSSLEKELESNQFLSRMDLPDLGDLTVFGTLRSVEGLPVHDKLVLERGGPIVQWYDRMTKQLSSS